MDRRVKPGNDEPGNAAVAINRVSGVAHSALICAAIKQNRRQSKAHFPKLRVVLTAHLALRVMPGTLILTNFAIVVIGASVGGVEAMRKLVARLDPEAPAAYFVALHVGPNESMLPSILNTAGLLPAQAARHGGAITPGRIFVAPADHHLLLEPAGMRLSRGPRENWSRPAIDPLFRTAAWAFGSRVIGVILTGMLNDGTAGLYEIRQRGGTTIVQDPGEAEFPDMPASALRHVEVDYWLSLASIPRVLSDVAREIAAKHHVEPLRAGVIP
jgi:two-component system chemotaxis response regulator CheB